ncbi:hypothetical protein K469DRAFT_719189 [Zopfia rhizophila CBS 207.26]|uniref:Uncharacterized protein n=1 Tax=Zopfia rhizophila CBS 207.26 TaxID=1314779 RepID=A0A6A6DJB4_9PEZI|nr:hypothetical protein K469DRAFT_719189 [Zopfia rhizophila CBS 207.26]
MSLTGERVAVLLSLPLAFLRLRLLDLFPRFAPANSVRDAMRLLRWYSTGNFSRTKDLIGDDKLPPYAILSYT